MFLAGCLLSWFLVVPDPMAHRATTRTAIVVLLIAAAGHGIFAKLLYANQLPALGRPPAQIRLGAQLMYYGGNIIEILVVIVVMASWYGRGGRALRREDRRSRADRSLDSVAASPPQ
jgi:putative membrane protein